MTVQRPFVRLRVVLSKVEGRGPAAIRIDRLAKYYGPVIGIEDVSLQVERGEVFGFLGANGAGKTTTIRVLLDLLRPSKGGASILGFDCHRQSLQSRRQVGYLPGELPVYPDLSAAGYLKHLSQLDNRPVAAEYLTGLLRRFDVSDLDLRRRLRDQSHGMKQKIGIVQALMTRPPVVILDEPTAGLDPFMVHAFREVIEDLRRTGTTVFLSSHVLTEVEATCDRVGIIRAGRIVNISALADLKAAAPRRVVIQFASAVARPPAIDAVSVRSMSPDRWEVDVNGPLESLMRVVAPLPVRDMSVEPFSLERHLLALYGPDLAPEGSS
jgi:ABC-2 type transport system ATP-binding protein